MKSISDDFYRENCSATLKPVLDSLVLTKASGVHLEVINLVIPTLNDKPEQIRSLVQWVKGNLGSDTPLHFSQFYPQYKMRYLPPTSAETLDTARQIAMSEGMKYVYIGNIASETGQNTYCPGCKKLLIERSGYTVLQNRLKEGVVRIAAKKFMESGNDTKRIFPIRSENSLGNSHRRIFYH